MHGKLWRLHVLFFACMHAWKIMETMMETSMVLCVCVWVSNYVRKDDWETSIQSCMCVCVRVCYRCDTWYITRPFRAWRDDKVVCATCENTPLQTFVWNIQTFVWKCASVFPCILWAQSASMRLILTSNLLPYVRDAQPVGDGRRRRTLEWRKKLAPLQ
jgi:hypothetical protein